MNGPNNCHFVYMYAHNNILFFRATQATWNRKQRETATSFECIHFSFPAASAEKWLWTAWNHVIDHAKQSHSKSVGLSVYFLWLQWGFVGPCILNLGLTEVTFPAPADQILHSLPSQMEQEWTVMIMILKYCRNDSPLFACLSSFVHLRWR